MRKEGQHKYIYSSTDTSHSNYRLRVSALSSTSTWCSTIVVFSKAECVQNTPARVFMGTKRYDSINKEVIHIIPILAKLHWLPVKSRVTFKLSSWPRSSITSANPARPHIWRRSLSTTNRWGNSDLRQICYWRLLDTGSRLHREHSDTRPSRFGTLFRWLLGNAEPLKL